MTRFELHFYKHLNRYRRLIQILSVLFIFIVPLLNKAGIHAIIGTFYSVSIGQLDIVDPALVLQNLLLTKEIHFPLLLAGIIPLVITLFFGKIFCSWICPFNLLAEFADKLRKKIRPKTIRAKNQNAKPQYYWLVFGSIISVAAVSGIPVITLTSMPGLISGQVADLIFYGAVGMELSIVLLILLLEVFFWPRFWCKYACPVGAVLALLRGKNTLAIQYDAHICANNCPVNLKKVSLCNAACPLQLNPRQKGIYPYCYNCGACIEACFNKGGKSIWFTFHPQETKTNKSGS